MREDEEMTEENVVAVEQRARNMGWLPKEEFRGNPDNWVGADKFVEMAETSLPHLKGTLKVMEDKMAEQTKLLEQQDKKFESLQQDLSDFVQFSRASEQRAYDKAMTDLQEKQLKAKTDGDLDAFVEATEGIDNLLKTHPAVTGEDRPKGSAGQQKTVEQQYQDWIGAEPNAFEDWVAENQWFHNDYELHSEALKIDQFLQQKYGFSKSRSFRLQEMGKMVKDRFPEKFGNTSKAKGSPVEGDSGGGPKGSNGKSYNDLPPDAKAKCDKWTGKDGKGENGTIKGLTRQEFVEQYFR